LGASQRVLLLVTFLIGGLGVGLAIKDHLLPRLEPLKDVKHFFVLRVKVLTRAHESTILQTIVFKEALISLGDAESLQASLVLQLKTCLRRAILNSAEDLDEEARVLDNAPTATNLFILNVKVAMLALVLNLDELDVCDEAENFDDVADDLVSRNRFNQLNLILSLEVCHLVLYLPNDFEVVAAEHQLGVDVD